MSDVSTISAATRDRAGKGGARATRRQGLVPGVIYGSKQAPLPIAIDPRVLWIEMNKAGFVTRLFDLKVGDKTERCLCRDVQRDPLSDQPVHVDFLRVSAESRIHVHVPVHFLNQEKSPGIKRGGVLNVVEHEIEVICPGDAIPHALEIDLAGLEIGASIHLSQLQLPQGVVAASRQDMTVATIAAPTVVTEAKEEAAPAAEGAAPAAAATPSA